MPTPDALTIIARTVKRNGLIAKAETILGIKKFCQQSMKYGSRVQIHNELSIGTPKNNKFSIVPNGKLIIFKCSNFGQITAELYFA